MFQAPQRANYCSNFTPNRLKLWTLATSSFSAPQTTPWTSYIEYVHRKTVNIFIILKTRAHCSVAIVYYLKKTEESEINCPEQYTDTTF